MTKAALLKAKLLKADRALQAMGDEVYKLYCELTGIEDEVIDHLLIKIDTDELLDAIPDMYLTGGES